MQPHQQPIQQQPRTDVQFQQQPTGGQVQQQPTGGQVQQQPTGGQVQQQPTGGQSRQQAVPGQFQGATAGGRQQTGAVDQFQGASGGTRAARRATDYREQGVVGGSQGGQHQQPTAEMGSPRVHAGHGHVGGSQLGTAEPVGAIDPSLAATGIRQQGYAQQAPLRAGGQLGATPQAGQATGSELQGGPAGQVAPVQQSMGTGIQQPIASGKSARSQGVQQPRKAQGIRQQAPQRVPQGTLSPQGVPEQSPGAQGIPQQSPAGQKLPQQTPGAQAIPQQSRAGQGTPRQSQGAQGIPQQSRAGQGTPQQSPGAQGIPQQSPAGQKLPQQTPGAQGIPRGHRSGQSIQQRSTVAQPSRQRPETGQQFAGRATPAYGGMEKGQRSPVGQMSGGASMPSTVQSPTGYGEEVFADPSIQGAPPVEGGTVPQAAPSGAAIETQLGGATAGQGVATGGSLNDVGASGVTTGQSGQLRGDPSLGVTPGLQFGGTPQVQR